MQRRGGRRIQVRRRTGVNVHVLHLENGIVRCSGYAEAIEDPTPAPGG
jgi:hypothetical protein